MKDRFDLGKFAGTAFLAATLAACGSGAPKTPDQTTSPTQTPGATENFIKTPTPTEQVKKTPEQIAIELGVLAWLQNLNLGTKTDQPGQAYPFFHETHKLTSEVDNIEALKNTLLPLALNGQQSLTQDNPILVNISSSYIRTDDRDPKSVGGARGRAQLQFKYLKLNATPMQQSDADKANGVFKERFNFSFAVSYRALVETSYGKDLPFINNFISQPVNQDLPLFSPFIQTFTNVDVVLGNASSSYRIANNGPFLRGFGSSNTTSFYTDKIPTPVNLFLENTCGANPFCRVNTSG